MLTCFLFLNYLRMLLIGDERPTHFLSAQRWARAVNSVHCQKVGAVKASDTQHGRVDDIAL